VLEVSRVFTRAPLAALDTSPGFAAALYGFTRLCETLLDFARLR
jgi:hypothetical protein